MGLPAQERFTIKEVAVHLTTSEPHVEDLLRRRQFSHVIIEKTPGPVRASETITLYSVGPWTAHYYFDRTLWKFNKSRFYQESERTFHYLLSKDDRADVTWLENARAVSIPRTAMEAFEQEHDIHAVAPTVSPTTPDGGGTEARLLRIANEVHFWLYVQGNFQSNQADKTQIRDRLNERYKEEKLSNNEKQLIATMVNKKKKGGAPPSRK